MIPEIVKDARGRIVGYDARLWGIEATGQTPAEATARWQARLQKAVERLSVGTTTGAWKDPHTGQVHEWILAPDLHGWKYWLSTFSSRAYWVMHGEDTTAEQVSACMMHHLITTCWTPDGNDEEYLSGAPRQILEELRRYFRWQRQYAALRARGIEDERARRIVDGLEAQTCS